MIQIFRQLLIGAPTPRRKDKRRIFSEFGSNFSLKDQELLLEAKFPFELIKEGVKKTRIILAAFEPAGRGIDITKNPLEEALSSIWSG